MSAKTATKKNAEVKNEKKEFKLERAMVFWIKASKEGSRKYLSGKTEAGVNLVGFFNLEKQNPKEPDIKCYVSGENKELSKEAYISLWCNASDAGKKYVSGSLNGKRVIGFFNSKAQVNGKIPYLNVYFSEDKPENKVETKEPEFEEVAPDNDLPF